MSKHLRRAIQVLMRRLITMSARVEKSVRIAMDAVEKMDPALARTVIGMDEAIDQEEMDIEEECLKVLALHQPVATDLRTIVAVLKINNDLERIGDLSVDIAGHALKIINGTSPGVEFDFTEIFSRVGGMLKDSLDSLIHMNVETARRVMEMDDQVDEMNRMICARVLEAMKNNPDQAEPIVQFMHVSKRLERIGDMATNIAEDLIYLVSGEIVRHGAGLETEKKDQE